MREEFFMKKFLMIMFSSLLLVACSSDKNELSDMFGEANESESINEGTQSDDDVVEDTESAETGEESDVSEEEIIVQTKDVQAFEEFERLNEVTNDVSEYNVLMEEENENNRVLLLEKDQKKVYKSVYVKKDQHLKVIDLQSNEQVYNDYVISKVDEEIAEKNSALNQYDEYSTLSNVIDIFSYESKVQTDNRDSRVIIFSDSNGKKVYKSVYTKKKKRLKVIQLSNDELLFNETL